MTLRFNFKIVISQLTRRSLSHHHRLVLYGTVDIIHREIPLVPLEPHNDEMTGWNYFIQNIQGDWKIRCFIAGSVIL